MGISLFHFFSIIAVGIAISAIVGIYFGRRKSHEAFDPRIDNSDHGTIDDVITADFKIDYED